MVNLLTLIMALAAATTFVNGAPTPSTNDRDIVDQQVHGPDWKIIIPTPLPETQERRGHYPPSWKRNDETAPERRGHYPPSWKRDDETTPTDEAPVGPST
jgi:hypothetical protein